MTMSEQTPTRGTIEILTPDGQSIGLEVQAATPADIPVILRAVYGFGEIVDKAAEKRANRTPKREWKARNGRGQEIAAVLWEAREFTDTEIGQSWRRRCWPAGTRGRDRRWYRGCISEYRGR